MLTALMTTTWRTLSRRHHHSQHWAVKCARCLSDFQMSAASAEQIIFGDGVKQPHTRACSILCTLCSCL